jgi:hypothetical protein
MKQLASEHEALLLHINLAHNIISRWYKSLKIILPASALQKAHNQQD